MRRRRTPLLSTIAFACLLTGGASALAAPEDEATSQEVLDELRRLRDRVGELEDWKADREREDAAREAADTETLERAIDELLAKRGADPIGGGVVRAPKSVRIDFGGQFRVRGEATREAYAPFSPNGGVSNDFFLGRTRLHADVQIAEDLRGLVELQDARSWGSEPGTAGNLANTDLSQGWVEFANVASTPLRLRLGRQSVALSDQRLIGALEWSNNGRRFDGLTANWKEDGLDVTAFAYRVAEGGFAGKDADLYGTWWVLPGVADASTLELFAIYLNAKASTPSEPRAPALVSTQTGRTRFGTYGFRFHGAQDNGPLDWDVQAATQRGEFAGDDLSAYAARAEVGVRVSDDATKPRFSLEYNFASGDESTNDGDRDQFETLFPTNHGHYGIHDYVSWENTRSWGAHFQVAPSKGWKVKVSYWRFELDEEAGGWSNAGGALIRPGANGGLDRGLGTEIDLITTWQVNERVQLQLGWAHFTDGAFIRKTQVGGGARDSDFLYVQVLVTF